MSEAILGEDADDVPFPLALHIARHDPARTLRQTSVLRDRVNLWSKMAGTHARTCLRAIAAIYADHPDYQPEWRP
ncbi:DUF6221 family protein [Streptomyces sp. NPDC059651]|uniref:DUF6221 family protein n=1 Tax=Streptomyces sp. NPDC059651 TaxID=3346897 RepID=UPI0036A5254C